MPRVWLDDEFHSHPKVIAAGLDGAGLFTRALSYCGAYLTDGFVPEQWATLAAGGKRPVLKKLVDAGLWKKVAGGYQIPDYLEHNDSKAEVVKYRAERSRSGKKGARRRWGGGKDARPLFDDDGESHSDSHSSSDSSRHSDSHSSRAHEEDDGSGMARDRAATTSTTTTTPAAEEREEGPAAALAEAEAPREARVAEVVGSLRGNDGGSFNQILPLALQLDAGSFESVVAKLGERRNVDNETGLLRWLLEQEIGQRVRNATAEIRGNGAGTFIPSEPPPDLEGFVRDFAGSWSDVTFEEAFDKWDVVEDERIRLVDLAADLRREVPA